MTVCHTVCNFCHVLCPTAATVESGRITGLEADRAHPYGGLMCVKGKAANELVEHPDRVLHPLRRVGAKTEPARWVRVGWDEALDDIARRLLCLRAEDGAESVAFARGTPTGTGLCDASRWVSRLMHAFGTPNLIGTTHTCQWARDDGARYTFGVDTPLPDLANAGAFLLWGHNPSTTSIALAQEIKAALSRGMRLVTVDPRRVGLATQADLHLPVRPGTDGALALSLAGVLVERGLFDEAFVRHWTNAPWLVRRDTGALLRWEDVRGAAVGGGYVASADGLVRYDPESGTYDAPPDVEDALELFAERDVELVSGETAPVVAVFRALRERLSAHTPERAAFTTGVPAEDIVAAAELLARSRPVAHYFWNGITQSTNGGQTGRAISVLYALFGDWDAPGGNVLAPRAPLQPVHRRGLFPPAMLARRLGFRERPLGPPRTAQDSTAYDLYRSVLEGKPYAVRALVDFGHNMIMAGSGSAEGRAALSRLDFMVYVDHFVTPTAELADYVLPAATFLESAALVARWERPVAARTHVQYRAPALAPRGEARADAEIIFDLAVRLGLGSEFWNGDLEAAFRHELEPTGIRLEDLRAAPVGLQTVSPVPTVGHRSYAREGFATPTKKIELYSVAFGEHGEDPLPCFVPPDSAAGASPELVAKYPLTLTNAKLVQFCHSQHRALPSLRRAQEDPELELHPDTAAEAGVKPGDWASLKTPEGALRARVKVSTAIRPGVVVMTHGWWQGCAALDLPAYAPYSVEGANVNLLVDNRARDPISGATLLRGGRCRVEPSEAGPVSGRDARPS